jgi:hypothetical protein
MHWNQPRSPPASIRPEEKKQGRFRRTMRNQQHKSGKQQQAQHSELEISATLQELIPAHHVL